MSETNELLPELFARLTRDLKQAAATLSPHEARYLVDAYYQVQDYRIVSNNRVKALSKSEEPHDVIFWLGSQIGILEMQIRRALDAWTDGSPVGKWAKSICGIGPVLAAGLLAHIDIEQAPTVGHIWRFAGLDPGQQWLGKEKAEKTVKNILEGLKLNEAKADQLKAAVPLVANVIQCRPEYLLKLATISPTGKVTKLTADSLVKAASKRPWNAQLKVLCWKISESFVKVCNQESDFYGKLYTERKKAEWEHNLNGDLSAQASEILAKKSFGSDKLAAVWYKGLLDPRVVREMLVKEESLSKDQKCAVPMAEEGKGVPMLPPGHIHARAERWTVKLFLAHYHHVAYWHRYGTEPPKPYVISILGHADMIAPPNFP